MNMENENKLNAKKEYVAPQMTIIEMETSAALLQDSGAEAKGFADYEFDDEFN